MAVNDNKVRGVRQKIPSGYFIGRTAAGDGKAQLISAGELRRLINPGFIKSQAPTLALSNNHIFVGNASNVPTDVAMSGDATIVASGALTIANKAVTYAKIQDISAASLLLGRGSAGGAGSPQEIALGTNLSMSGTTLNAANGGGGSVDISPFSDNSITKPVAANFTVVDDTTANHGTGAIVDLATRGVNMKHTQSGTPISSQSLFKVAAISNTLVSTTAYVQPNLYTSAGSAWFFGLAVRDNGASGGKIDAFGIRSNGTVGAFVEFQYTSISSVSSAPGGTAHGVPINNRPIWLRLAKVATNFVFSASFDGETFFTVSTTSATAFVSSTLNDVGIFIVNNLGVANAPFNIDCFSFTVS